MPQTASRAFKSQNVFLVKSDVHQYLTLDSLIFAAEVGRMLGWMLLMAVTVSHALCFVDITGKAALIPVCSTAACGSLFACSRHCRQRLHPMDKLGSRSWVVSKATSACHG
jgi:hypothetical protein